MPCGIILQPFWLCCQIKTILIWTEMSKQNSTSIKNLFSVKRAAKFMQIEQVKNWTKIERVFFSLQFTNLLFLQCFVSSITNLPYFVNKWDKIQCCAFSQHKLLFMRMWMVKRAVKNFEGIWSIWFGFLDIWSRKRDQLISCWPSRFWQNLRLLQNLQKFFSFWSRFKKLCS